MRDLVFMLLGGIVLGLALAYLESCGPAPTPLPTTTTTVIPETLPPSTAAPFGDTQGDVRYEPMYAWVRGVENATVTCYASKATEK